jgi:hypothetical protein
MIRINLGAGGPVQHACGETQLIGPRSPDALMLSSMPDDAVLVRNADAPWNKFSSGDYWRDNYSELQAEDQEIIRLVSHFFIDAFADGPPARRGIDVGSGPNLYPALLMLPWTKQLLLTDFSASNVRWLRHQLADDGPAWAWQPFWLELCDAEGYQRIAEPRKQLREACFGQAGYAGIERNSIFALPEARWDVGTMFFVAESITQDPEEFGAALTSFIRALTPGAPFATAFMAGSKGYPVASTDFPALPITPDDLESRFTELDVDGLNVELLRTSHRVRDGYEAMIVATGYVGDPVTASGNGDR